MLLSILLLIIIALIALDSFGSKRIRARVIREAKAAFEEKMKLAPKKAPFLAEDLNPVLEKYLKKNGFKKEGDFPVNARLRFKGAERQAKGKSWKPIEAKAFLRVFPKAFLWYQDMTLTFLVSRKRVLIMRDGQPTYSTKHLLSVFRQAPKLLAEAEIEGLLNYLAGFPWLPTVVFDPLVQIEVLNDQSFCLSFKLGNTEAKGVLRLDKKNRLEQAEWTLNDPTASALHILFTYQDYREHEGRWIPFKYKCTRSSEKKPAIMLEMELIDLVYDEAFRWW